MFRSKFFQSHKKQDCPVKILSSRGDYGDRIVGWWISEKPPGLFTSPEPRNLSFQGWLQITCLSFVCFPCMCLPCFLSSNYDEYQTPVFDSQLEKPNS